MLRIVATTQPPFIARITGSGAVDVIEGGSDAPRI
jgi:hypothetical protein